MTAQAGAGLRLTLLSRAYCHLCDDMRDALAPIALRHGAHVVELDVDADPALERDYGDRVPVLLLGPPGSAVELAQFHLDPAAVEAALTRR
jgi:hypothetical protein